MGDSLAPKLRKRVVPSGKLILDPNNPRLVTRDEDCHDEVDYPDGNLQDTVIGKLRGDEYRIKELESSIRQNGWLPVDFIFVRQHSDGEHYVVLEGNRRVTAIRDILSDETADEDLRRSLKAIDVMEILDDLPPEELRRKISYLLGVRHHGSLVKWTPFAQADNIYSRYIEASAQDWESFTWDTAYGQQVADALSISLQEVEERLRTYRAMRQIGNVPEVENSQGEMKDRCYSVCAELLLRKTRKVNEYIPQDPVTFLLDDEGVRRFDNLCHFSEPNRDGAPIRNPQEWRKFENILREEDDERREQMLHEVEVEKRCPSDVWAERAAELQKLQWDKWLLKVNAILKAVTLADDLESEEAKAVVRRLVQLIKELDQRDIDGGRDA